MKNGQSQRLICRLCINSKPQDPPVRSSTALLSTWDFGDSRTNVSSVSLDLCTRTPSRKAQFLWNLDDFMISIVFVMVHLKDKARNCYSVGLTYCLSTRLRTNRIKRFSVWSCWSFVRMDLSGRVPSRWAELWTAWRSSRHPKAFYLLFRLPLCQPLWVGRPVQLLHASHRATQFQPTTLISRHTRFSQ